ncbi:hypothetical protein ABPG75_013997 [Micractinium tetrahymenae]
MGRQSGQILLVALLALPAALALCNDPQLVNFGTGVTTLFTSTSEFRVDEQNTFSLDAVCTLSGTGASTSPDRWRAQLIYCGTGPCKDTNLPDLGQVRSTCSAGGSVGKSCTLGPANPVNVATSHGVPTSYSVNFKTTISNAYQGKTTFYYVKCFYLCGGDASQAQERAAASFTLEGAAPAPSPPPSPSPPPPSPPNPEEPNFYGVSTAIIKSPLQRPSGLIYAPDLNIVPVQAVCKVTGQYAMVNLKNWPAQLLVCGDPPGSDSCTSTAFDPTGKLITPVDVTYNGTTYTAVYEFNIDKAVLIKTQTITYRFFSCLYSNGAGSVSKRAGASIDVINPKILKPTVPNPPPAQPSPPPPTTKPSPPPPRTKPTVTRPPPPPPADAAQGYGDPHFMGFDGKKFDYHGGHTWYPILESKGQSFLFRALFAAGYIPKTTVMSAFELRTKLDTITVNLTLGVPPVRQLSARANNRALPAGKMRLLSGTTVEVVPTRVRGIGRVVITTDFIRVVVIQKWRPKLNDHAPFLDFNVFITKQLRLPVTGLLGPSYTAAVLSRLPAATNAGASASAAAVAAVPSLSASATSDAGAR